jgi:hypothetical protein
MSKPLTFEFTAEEVAEFEATMEALFAEMQRANEPMKQDQAEIDRLKAETRAIAEETRAIIEQLEAKE